MDLTVLELGLRNHQLLQVKCFLKIQVETFRHFLTEEIGHMKQDDRFVSIEKFFVHDWQNVVNKVVSVAVVNVSGDYGSKLFAVSLFKSLSQSCNQLIIIVSTMNITQTDEESCSTNQNVFARSLSTSSLSTEQGCQAHQTCLIKKKIYLILVKIIDSINCHLEKIHNDFSITKFNQISNQETFLKSENPILNEYIDEKGNICKEYDNQQVFETFLEQKNIPLFQFILKRAQSKNNFTNKVYHQEWDLIVEKIIELVSTKLKTMEITENLIEKIEVYLSQTGLSSLYLLFRMFIQTCDACLRQKILQVFFKRYGSILVLEDRIQQELPTTDNDFVVKEVDFAKYVKLMSIIDMYVFCYRLKLNDLQPLEVSIEWILNLQSRLSYIKSLIFPVLEEIVIHSDLFVDWKELNEQIFCGELSHLHKYFIQEKDFSSLVSAKGLWEYWIDNNRTESLLNWIQNGSVSLPYCSNIVCPEDFETCQQMIQYLINNSSIFLKNKIFQALCLHESFFNSYSLKKLSPDCFDFQKILFYFGISEQSQTSVKSSDNLLSEFVNQPSSSNQKLFQLIDYCVQNELYEFLYHFHSEFVCNKPALQLPQTLSTRSSFIMKFLNEFHLKAEGSCGNYVFHKSILFHKFLLEIENNDSSLESYIIDKLIYSQKDIELLLTILAFSNEKSFDKLDYLIKQQTDNTENSQFKLFWSILNSKYPLISKSFQHNKQDFITDGQVPSSPNLNQNSYNQNFILFDLYSLFQQAIRFVNTTKFFKWQINRRLSMLRNMSFNDFNTVFSDQLLATSPDANSSNSLAFENNELPHFSQKRLTELYGLQAELTISYYLKNFRPIEAFIQYFKLRQTKLKQSRSKDKYLSINGKLSIKAMRKSILVAYSSIRQTSVFSCCLLFQLLVKFCFQNQSKGDTKNHSENSIQVEIQNELNKTALHLSIGKLIIEYVPDFLSLQGVQQQQAALAVLLRKSHFHSDRSSAQKLLDLATVAIERKFTSPLSSQNRFNKNICIQSILNIRLHSLLENQRTRQSSELLVESPLFDQSLILMECFDWKPIFMFAKLHDLPQPFNFLTKCAQEDNWLVFTIFAQMYEIPKEDILKFLREANFNNQCIGEHLTKAFQNFHRVNPLNADSKFLKIKQNVDYSRQELYSKLFRGKVPSQSVQVTNIGKKISEQSSFQAHSPNTLSHSYTGEGSIFTIDTESFDTLSMASNSIFSKLSDDSGSSLHVIFEQQLSPEMISKDFLQLVLEIYQNCIYFESRANNTSFSFELSFCNSLLFASVSISNPILALLACSLDRSQQTPLMEIKSLPGSSSYKRVDSPTKLERSSLKDSKLQFTSFLCWLLASSSAESKKSFVDSSLDGNYFTKKLDSKSSLIAQCYLNWTPNRSLHLIDVFTQKDSRNFILISRGLQIFNLNIKPVQTLLNFLIRFFIEKDYYQSNDLLLEFQSQLMNYNDEEYLTLENISGDNFDDDDHMMNNCCTLRIFYSKKWVEKCSIILITNSILLAQQFELGILLSYYNFVRIQDTFSRSQERIPDIRRFYFFSQCLSKLPSFSLPISQLIFYDSDTMENEEHHCVNILRKLIFDMQEGGYFDEARNIVTLLPKTKTNEFIINEWMLKAKKAEMSSEIILATNGLPISKIDLEFWNNCWSQVTKIDPSMHSAFKVMERFVQNLEPNQMLIKCFVLLKCLLAVETILKDYLENDIEVESTPNTFDDTSTISSDNQFNYLDLVQEFDQFEFDLWLCAVECEFCINTFPKVACEEKVENPDQVSVAYSESIDSTLSDSWETIWKSIVGFMKTSAFSSQIIPWLSQKYSYQYKNINKKRPKHSTSLEPLKQKTLTQIIGKLFNSFSFEKARYVSELFSYTHDDFELIKGCDNAAKGILKDFNDAPLSLHLKIQKSCSTSILNLPSQFTAHKLSDEQKHIIHMIQTFASFSTIGKKTCEYILLLYKISCILDKPYSELIDPLTYTSLKVLELLISSEKIDLNGTKLTNLEQSDTVDSREIQFTESQSFCDNYNQQFFTNKYAETINCARDLIKISADEDDDLNCEKIINIIAQDVLNNVQSLVEQQFDNNLSTNSSITEIELDKAQLSLNSSRFLILIRILPEPSVLGYKLISILRKEKSKFEEKNKYFLKKKHLKRETPGNGPDYSEFVINERRHHFLLVELYIKAQECFTTQCDVRGIALVLRKLRILITQDLQSSGHYHLILRLLTGIGRYSEMTYCFDIFKESDRFELILSKRVQRTPQLRIALLNYLKTAKNLNELLPLVAIRFFLFRETADYHKAKAERILNDITLQYSSTSQTNTNSKQLNLSSSFKKRVSSSISLSELGSNSPNSSVQPAIVNQSAINTLREQLETAMYEFQEAECNFTKASSHNNADYCNRKAQLVALQIAYLNKSKTNEQSTNLAQPQTFSFILNLDQNQLREFIYYCSQYYEASIVAKGYPNVNIDWIDPFFNNVILNNNLTYLSHYTSSNRITISFLGNLVKRYEQLLATFKQQNKPTKVDLVNSLNQSNSPSTASINLHINQIRSQFEFQKIRRNLEQLLELLLCPFSESLMDQTNRPPININSSKFTLKEKYSLAKKFNSTRILQRLLETDCENSAYLLDLKRNQKL